MLQLYNQDSSIALEMGIDAKRGDRFIHFFGKQGRILAALNTVSSGDPTLYLQNQTGTSRLTLGALVGDVLTDEPTNDWGLEFRKPGAPKPVFGASVKFSQNSIQSWAALRLIRQDGSEWSVR